jgi:hypothetical protein
VLNVTSALVAIAVRVVSCIFYTLYLHAFEPTVNLVLVELCLEEIGDAFEHLCLEFLAGSDKLIMVILVEHHVIPLERKRVRLLWHVAGRKGFGGAQHLLEATCMGTRRGHQILSTSQLHVDILQVANVFVPEYCADKEGDPSIEVSLLITIFTLASSFRLIFKRFREVFTKYLEPGGAQDVLKFKERLGPAPVKSSSCLVELR